MTILLRKYAPLAAAAYLDDTPYPDEPLNSPLRQAIAVAGFDFVKAIRFQTAFIDTRCFLASSKWSGNELVIAFCGTADEKNILTDAEIHLTPCRFSASCALSRTMVHFGFLDAYRGVQSTIWYAVNDYRTKNPGASVSTTGHSLGGALASLCAADLAYHRLVPYSMPLSSRTFGSPRVGDAKWHRAYNELVPDTLRAVHGDDIVPLVPFWPYRHVGHEFQFDSNGHVIGHVRSWFRWLLSMRRETFAIMDGSALRSHGMDTYVAGLNRTR